MHGLNLLGYLFLFRLSKLFKMCEKDIKSYKKTWTASEYNNQRKVPFQTFEL